MKLKDVRGLEVSTGNAAALGRYEQAAVMAHSYFGNPIAALDEALALQPDFAMAQAMRAALAVMSTEEGAMPMLRDAVDAIDALGRAATQRERMHSVAARAWLDRDFHRSVKLYGDIAVEYPLDLLAIQTAHVIDFNLGDAAMLRDRPAQALPAWSAKTPGYGYLLGMHAFGLEETANYTRAEDVGRRALDLNARDPWTVHAVQHVFEMQGRIGEGVEWLNKTAPDWRDSALAFHNWWHLALHCVDMGETAQALELYDRLIHPKESVVALELLDASQLLWRISLPGTCVGRRWADLADCWAKPAEAGFYVFNDLHALMAYSAAGRTQDVERTLKIMEKRAWDDDANARHTRDVGLPLARAIVAMSAEKSAEALELLLPIRSRVNRLGGSHAQRDIVNLTCIEAALHSGHARLARALASERIEQKPASPFNWQLTARALDAQGDRAAADSARDHAAMRRQAQLRREAA